MEDERRYQLQWEDLCLKLLESVVRIDNTALRQFKVHLAANPLGLLERAMYAASDITGNVNSASPEFKSRAVKFVDHWLKENPKFFRPLSPPALNLPKKVDDWCECINAGYQQYYEKYGEVPTEAQMWTSLVENPPPRYSIKIIEPKAGSRKGTTLLLNDNELDRGNFNGRWGRYKPGKKG